MVVKADHENKEWLSWEEPVLKREETALRKCREQLHDEIGFYMFLQLKFDEQWKTLKSFFIRQRQFVPIVDGRFIRASLSFPSRSCI